MDKFLKDIDIQGMRLSQRLLEKARDRVKVADLSQEGIQDEPETESARLSPSDRALGGQLS